MSLINFQDQEAYNVKNGEVFLDVEMASESNYFPFPLKKEIHLELTGPQSNSSQNDHDVTENVENKAQPQRIVEPQIANEFHNPQNQNSTSISDINSDYNDRYQDNYYFLDSAHFENHQSENILSHEISLFSEAKVQEKALKVEKNDSKNVPKGMMKAFAHMILKKNPETFKMLKRLFDDEEADLDKYKENMKKIRKQPKISIDNIRDLLMNDEFAVTTRKLVNFFMRKMFKSHIFNSKMEKRSIHLKYIPRWLQILKDPSDFRSLK